MLTTTGAQRAGGHSCVRVEVFEPTDTTVETEPDCEPHATGTHSCTTASLVVVSAVVCVDPPGDRPSPPRR